MVKKQVVRVHKDAASREITRLWGDVPVVDAKKDLRVFITPSDVESATRKDPGACVFAKACSRSFGCKRVLIYRATAYVELPSENGALKVERFTLTPAMRSLVEAFDKGEIVIPAAGFVLRAPSKSQTLDGIRKNWHRNGLKNRARKRATRRQLLGESAKSEKAYCADPIHGIVRNGTGAVHFIPTKKKAETTK